LATPQQGPADPRRGEAREAPADARRPDTLPWRPAPVKPQQINPEQKPLRQKRLNGEEPPLGATASIPAPTLAQVIHVPVAPKPETLGEDRGPQGSRSI